MKRTVIRHRRAPHDPARAPEAALPATTRDALKRALTAQQTKDVELSAAESHGVPVSILMESAGAALADAALALASPEGRFIVLCGRGNNGGDGLVAARRIAGKHRIVQVELVVDPSVLEGDPARNHKALRASGVECSLIPASYAVGPGDVVIDALLGTGLNRPPEGEYAEGIRRIAAWRAAGAKVVSADLPSGLQSDTGQALGQCVQADLTLAFGHLKVGHVLEPGASLAGEVREADLGLPAASLAAAKGAAVFLLEEALVRVRLPERKADTHKGTYGHVLAVAGSWGKTGAAALCGLGALRAGAGLVSVATRPEALVPVMAHAPELMGVELVADGALGLGDLNSLLDAADGKDAVVIGPGIPRGADTAKLLGALLEELTVPCVLDADALNALAGNLGVLKAARAPLVLTPHPGEAARLLGKSTAEVQADRLGAARALAQGRPGTVVVLKGARTLVAFEDGTVLVNPTGNAGMATGGTGDVLSGVLAALLGQGLSVADAVSVGVFAHGLAGELASVSTGKVGLVASDLLEGLCQVWTRWGR